MDINKLNYIDYGVNKKGVIVLLHGWSQNIEMMNMLGEPFKDEYRVIVLDLPGFGKSSEPDDGINITDFANILHELLVKLKVENPIIIGHSVGGRIGIMYASMYKVKKLVLLSAPFRPSKKSKGLKVRLFKIAKKFKCLKGLANYLKKKWGSTDYNNASDVMRKTLVKVVNQDLTEDALKINCPTLLIYGDKDDVVLINEGYELEKLIKDSGLVKYVGCGHYAYLERLKQTISVLKVFLG